MISSTSLWDRLVGRAGRSAAFGVDTPIKEHDEAAFRETAKSHHNEASVSPRARGVDTAEGARRSKSADSDATLVEDDDDDDDISSEERESATSAPSFTIDGSSRGLVLQEGQWKMTNQELSHRLQNVSQYPKSTIAIARRHLFAELHHLLLELHHEINDTSSIMSLSTTFDIDSLDRFLQQQHDSTTNRYAAYSARRTKARQDAMEDGLPYAEARRAGCEMFDDEGVEQCTRWLQQASVVKYVDGSWLASLYRNSTGMQKNSDISIPAQRKAARASWLVMSEELGDGDIARSHVAIYEKLMDRLSEARGGISTTPPKGEEAAFIEWPPVAKGNDRCWRAACVQLCLSASPSDFLPEALGFNLAYESLPYHLLVSARETEELLDADAAYYFYLHISIDNSSSGHSAMAKKAVIDYLTAAKETGGESLAAEMWARIKLGFALAEAIPTTPLLHHDDNDDTPQHLCSTIITAEDVDIVEAPDRKRDAVIDILKRKAKSASGLHASVQARLAGRSIAEWLDVNHVEERIPLLLDALSDSPVWIKRGDAEASRFVCAFEWGGKMFGALTGKEVSLLKDWVNSLPFTEVGSGREEDWLEEDRAVDLPTDTQIECPSRRSMSDFLRTHCSNPTLSDWIDASLLRPRLPQRSIASWSDLGSTLYPALLARLDAQHLALPDQANLLQTLGKSDASLVAAELNEAQIRSLLPTLLLTTSLLERVISASCGRLASPLGMACVKILRILLGFTEISLPPTDDGLSRQSREVGCMGTDDLEGEQMGVWELVQVLHSRLEGGKEAGALSMSSLQHRPACQLALPALMLQLGADVWTNMPILLGMTSFLTGHLLCHKSVLASFNDSAKASTLASIADRSNAWVNHAIALGGEGRKDENGEVVQIRGWKGKNWRGHVELGKRLARNGVAKAVSQVG